MATLYSNFLTITILGFALLNLTRTSNFPILDDSLKSYVSMLSTMPSFSQHFSFSFSTSSLETLWSGKHDKWLLYSNYATYKITSLKNDLMDHQTPYQWTCQFQNWGYWTYLHSVSMVIFQICMKVYAGYVIVTPWSPGIYHGIYNNASWSQGRMCCVHNMVKVFSGTSK